MRTRLASIGVNRPVLIVPDIALRNTHIYDVQAASLSLTKIGLFCLSIGLNGLTDTCFNLGYPEGIHNAQGTTVPGQIR